MIHHPRSTKADRTAERHADPERRFDAEPRANDVRDEDWREEECDASIENQHGDDVFALVQAAPNDVHETAERSTGCTVIGDGVHAGTVHTHHNRCNVLHMAVARLFYFALRAETRLTAVRHLKPNASNCLHSHAAT